MCKNSTVSVHLLHIQPAGGPTGLEIVQEPAGFLASSLLVGGQVIELDPTLADQANGRVDRHGDEEAEQRSVDHEQGPMDALRFALDVLRFSVVGNTGHDAEHDPAAEVQDDQTHREEKASTRHLGKRRSTSEVEPGTALGQPIRSYSVDVALAQDDVVLAPDLDLVAILGVEEHPIAGLHVAHVRPHGHDFSPHQPFAHLGSGRNEDPAGRSPLTLGTTHVDHDPVVQHLDGELLIIGGRRVGHTPTVPSPDMVDDSGAGSTGTGTAVEGATCRTHDGLALEAEIAVPESASGAVVLAHPHPQQGGSMRSLVTSELFRSLPRDGIATLRFNFRGVEGSEGTYGGGVYERNDVIAAIDRIREATTAEPLVLAGWSFGADVSASVLDDRLAGWFLIAPPLRILSADQFVVATDPRPKHLAVPEHDAFRPPASARQATADWVNTTIEDVAGADHFFVGRTAKVASALVAFVRQLAG
jgi:uncharacterized protein